MLNVLPFSAEIADNGRKTYFVDRAQSVCRKAQCDEAVFIREPQAFFLQIRLKTAFCNTRDFKADPLFLFSNPA